MFFSAAFDVEIAYASGIAFKTAKGVVDAKALQKFVNVTFPEQIFITVIGSRQKAGRYGIQFRYNDNAPIEKVST